MLIAVLVYIACPLDIIVDVIPVFGFLDDVVVAAIVFSAARNRLLLEHCQVQNQTAQVFKNYPGPHFNRPRFQEFVDSQPVIDVACFHRDPYRVLNIEAPVSAQQVRAAYRRLCAQYHPDKVTHLGEDVQSRAHEKMIELRQAYEQLTKAA